MQVYTNIVDVISLCVPGIVWGVCLVSIVVRGAGRGGAGRDVLCERFEQSRGGM